MTDRTLLIDADIVAFKFAAKAQSKYPFGLAVDDLEDVTPLVDEYLADMKVNLKATQLIICLSAPSAEGWRKDILPSYKENRKGVEHPVHLAAIKDHMEHSYPSYRKPRLEADDIMGILSTHPTLVAGDRIIVSEDKDMKTIPGWLFNPAKDTKPRLITEAEADYWHMYQTIVGDNTDGYKGCPGAGPVAAAAALRDGDDFRYFPVADMWQLVVDLYTYRRATEDDALVQARVARICRASDYDFKTQQVIHWTPPAKPQQEAPTVSPASTTNSKTKTSSASTRSALKKGV